MRLDDSLIFRRGANQGAGELQIRTLREGRDRLRLQIVIRRGELQFAIGSNLRGWSCAIPHGCGEGEQSALIAALRFLDVRLELALEELGAHQAGPIGLARSITVSLSADILCEPFPLCFPERAERVVIERRVEGDAGRVQLSDDRDVEALLGEQDLDVATTARSGNGRIE